MSSKAHGFPRRNPQSLLLGRLLPKLKKGIHKERKVTITPVGGGGSQMRTIWDSFLVGSFPSSDLLPGLQRSAPLFSPVRNVSSAASLRPPPKRILNPCWGHMEFPRPSAHKDGQSRYILGKMLWRTREISTACAELYLSVDSGLAEVPQSPSPPKSPPSSDASLGGPASSASGRPLFHPLGEEDAQGDPHLVEPEADSAGLNEICSRVVAHSLAVFILVNLGEIRAKVCQR